MHGLTLPSHAPLRELDPMIRRTPHATTKKDLTQSRKGNAYSDLCVFACPPDCAWAQRFDKRLTPRRKKISRKAAKPQRKRMVFCWRATPLCVSRCVSFVLLVDHVVVPSPAWTRPARSWGSPRQDSSPNRRRPRPCPTPASSAFTLLANSSQPSLPRNATEGITHKPRVRRRDGREGV